MHTVEYKGFNYFCGDNGRYYIVGWKGKPDGFATESACKVAITKYLDKLARANDFSSMAEAEEYSKEVERGKHSLELQEAFDILLPKKSCAASSDDKERASIHVDDVRRMAEAMLPVRKAEKESKPLLSRNQREGKYRGFVITYHRRGNHGSNQRKLYSMGYAQNRKARKLAKMADKHYSNW